MAECRLVGFTAHVDVTAGMIRASGRLDRDASARLLDAVLQVTQAGRSTIDIDVRGLTSVYPAGVKLLKALQHTLGTHGGRLRVLNARGAVAAALDTGQVMATTSIAGPRQLRVGQQLRNAG